MNGQWTPEQMAQWQAAQAGMTPEQMAQWQAAQAGMTPEQMAQWQAAQAGMTPEQMAQWQAAQAGMTPEQMAQWQTQQGAPTQSTDAELQWQAAQLGMTPEQLLQWQAHQKAQAALKAKRERKAKKKANRRPVRPIVRLLRIVAAVAVLAVVAWFVWDNSQGTKETSATIAQATYGKTYRGDAMIVRNETVYDDEGVQTIEYVAQEGSTVFRGDVICYVYSTGYSSKEMNSLQDYRDQIKNYQQTLLAAETAYDQKMTRLETQVVDRGLEVRSLVQGARGNLINQESILKTAIEARQTYFRSKYSSDMRLNRLYDDQETQQQRIDGWIKQRAAAQESIVSFYTDGYEHGLGPDNYEQYTPTQVRAMFNGEKPEQTTSSRGKTDIYRLVKQNNYVVLLLIKDSTWNPVEGETYKLSLEQFSNTMVSAQVLSYTRSGGELLVRLAVMGDVTPVLYMRTCQAELGEYADCLLVPSEALYTQNEQQGVVLMNADGTQVFVPVNVLGQENGKSYITAVQVGVLSTGQTVRLFR